MKKTTLPHAGLYTRLKSSKVHGVGVFAIRRIRKGTHLFAGDEEIIWIPKSEIEDLPKQMKKMYEDFAIIKDGFYGCPTNFNKLSMGWYLNNSDNPNVFVDENYDMWALRDIEEGEELTINSSKFSAQPYKELATAEQTN